MTTKRNEDYLEAIEAIAGKKGYARVKDVADRLGLALSSVTEMFQKLDETGYINYEKYSGVTLTSKGRRIAKRTKEKHEVLRDFLSVLGVDDQIADEDACKIEHIVNPETLEVLTKFVEFANMPKGGSRWLDHFRHFYGTGEYVECSPMRPEECPIHGKSKVSEK
jgi:DtxR family Mn-dependent transcriptional regulator